MKLIGPTYKRMAQTSSLASAVALSSALATEQAPQNNVFDLLSDLAGKVEKPVVMFFDMNTATDPYRYRVWAVEKDGSSAANNKIAAFSAAMNIGASKAVFTANNTDGAERTSDTWAVAVTGNDALVKVAARTAEAYKLGVTASNGTLAVGAPDVQALPPIDTDLDNVPDTSVWQVVSNGALTGNAGIAVAETIERPFTPWGLLKAITQRVSAADPTATVFAYFVQETGVLNVGVAAPGSGELGADTKRSALSNVAVDNTVNMVAFEIDPSSDAATQDNGLRWG